MTQEQLLEQVLQRIQARITANVNEKGLRASGRTTDTMRIEIEGREGRLKGRPYFQSLELGRPAGRVPYNFHSIIMDWIIDKGLSVTQIPYKRLPSVRWQPKYSVEERSLRIMAGRIAHSIRTRGTLLYRQGGRKDIYTPVIMQETERMRDIIVAQVVESIAQAAR